MKLRPLLFSRFAGATGAAALLGLLASLPTATAAPVTAPYMDTFAATAVGSQPANFTSGGGTWAVQNSGGANFYQNTVAANGGASYSVLQFSNINSTNTPTFSMNTTFTLSGTVDANNRVGLAAFANNTVSTEYLADVTLNGSVRLIGVNHPLTTTPTAAAFGNLTVGSTYTMTLAGSYANSGATLNLTYSVTGLFGGTQRTVTLVGQDTAPLSGTTQQYFGFRDNNASAASNTLTVNFQNFSVAVPEPSTVAVAALGLGVLLFVRARRSGAARA